VNATASPSYEAVCQELDRRRRVELGLERIEALLSLLGNPHLSLRVIQIVGTNGKGTTAVALASALEAAGYACGAYLSPHVLSYTERVMLRARYSSEGEFAAAMGKTIRVADLYGIPATQFEILTAGALLMFYDAGLKWAVLEAGLGARHDATSAAGPVGVVLTNVSLDHTEYLGDTVEEITEEKLASLKPHAALILGTDDPQVVKVARNAAARVNARMIEHEEMRDLVAEEVPYLAHNERLGVRAAEALLGHSLRREEREAAVLAAKTARPPARFETHEFRGTPIVVDGGHNPQGLMAALEAVRSRYGERPLGVVFGALKEKDVASMLNLLEREVHTLVLTRSNYGNDERALNPERMDLEYAPRDAGGRRPWVVSCAKDALSVAVEEMGKIGGVVLITGSLYTGAAVLEWLRGNHD
jgi:dihydrofolate synthase/folylpolyglutamate synthase